MKWICSSTVLWFSFGVKENCKIQRAKIKIDNKRCYYGVSNMVGAAAARGENGPANGEEISDGLKENCRRPGGGC